MSDRTEPVDPATTPAEETDRMIPSYDGILEHDHHAEWEGQETIRFFPDHFISEATAMILLLCLYSVLCIFAPAILEIRSNPAVMELLAKLEQLP